MVLPLMCSIVLEKLGVSCVKCEDAFSLMLSVTLANGGFGVFFVGWVFCFCLLLFYVGGEVWGG